jgi:hypothetical protein
MDFKRLKNGKWVIGGGIRYPVNVQEYSSNFDKPANYLKQEIIREDNATTEFLIVLDNKFNNIYTHIGSDLNIGVNGTIEQGYQPNEFFVGGVTRGTDSKIEYYSIH